MATARSLRNVRRNRIGGGWGGTRYSPVIRFALCLTINPKPDRRTRIASMYTKTTRCNTWSGKFGCTPDQLKAAVKKVGVMAKDVEAELKRK